MFLAKNDSAKNLPSEEFCGEECSDEECSDEEYSDEEYSDEECSDEESSSKVFSGNRNKDEKGTLTLGCFKKSKYIFTLLNYFTFNFSQTNQK
jgi:hypothetical protein